MTRNVMGGIVGSVVALVVICAAAVVLLVGGGVASSCVIPLPSGAVSVSAPAGGWPVVGRFTSEQVGHAAGIVGVGAGMGGLISDVSVADLADVGTPAGLKG